MKTIIILNKIKNNIPFYAFFLTSPFMLYLIIMIVYFICFIYFFADPILCQGDEVTSEETFPLSTLAEEAKAGESSQEPLTDPEINERGRQLKSFSENYAQQVNEKLNALNALHNEDMNKLKSASEKYKYWNHLYLEARERSLRNIDFENVSYQRILHHLEECKHYTKKIRITEAGIKVLDPDYISSSVRQWYE